MGCSSSKEVGQGAPNRVHKLPGAEFVEEQQSFSPQHKLSSPASPSSGQFGVQPFSAPGAWPKVVKVGGGPVRVTIHAHTLNSPPNQLPCWTYISQGLAAASQPEVVFTLLRRPNENIESFPESPLEFIKTVYGIANGGLHLETGEMLELVFDRDMCFLKINQVMIVQDPRKWEDMRSFGSFVHGIPLTGGCFHELNLPPNAFHVIALTHEETVVAKQFGVTRVVGHVGLSVRWFPYPPWIDRDRGDAVTLADQGGSVRTGTPIARLFGINAMLCEDDIILTIPLGDEKRKAFKDYVLGLPLSAAVGLDSFMVEEADSGLTWKRGQKDPMGYAANCGRMKNMNLGFIMFAPQQDRDHSIMCEDGYGILIRDQTWQIIRNAIQNTQDIIIPLENDKRFILRWKVSVFHNPIDGNEMTASWRAYEPSQPKPPSNSHVEMSQMVFLVQPPNGSVDTQELVNYLKQIHKIVEQRTPSQPLPAPAGIGHPGRQVIIEFELPKREGWLKMTAYPSVDGLDVQGILGNVATLVAPETRAVVKLQLFLALWGYQGPAAQFS